MDTIAEGLRTNSIGRRNFDIIEKHGPRMIQMSELDIVAAMRLIWERMKLIIEPSSAVPIAALIRNRLDFLDQRV